MSLKPLVLIILLLLVVVIITPRSVRFEQPMLTIRFDDCYSSQLKAVEILKENGLTATFFCITDLVGTKDYMEWSDVIALDENGFTACQAAAALTLSGRRGRFPSEAGSSPPVLLERGGETRSSWHTPLLPATTPGGRGDRGTCCIRFGVPSGVSCFSDVGGKGHTGARKEVAAGSRASPWMGPGWRATGRAWRPTHGAILTA